MIFTQPPSLEESIMISDIFCILVFLEVAMKEYVTVLSRSKIVTFDHSRPHN